MKRYLCTLLVMVLFLYLMLPSAAMEKQVINLSGRNAMLNCSVEQLEKQLGLKQGELSAVTFLKIPENGCLVSAGVVVEQGETLLRWELEELYYISANMEKDWFVMIPHAELKCCALVNISK